MTARANITSLDGQNRSQHQLGHNMTLTNQHRSSCRPLTSLPRICPRLAWKAIDKSCVRGGEECGHLLSSRDTDFLSSSMYLEMQTSCISGYETCATLLSRAMAASPAALDQLEQARVGKGVASASAGAFLCQKCTTCRMVQDMFLHICNPAAVLSVPTE